MIGGLYVVRDVLTPFIIGFFISYVLEPPVLFFQRRGLSRKASIALVYVIVFLAASALFAYFIPEFMRDLREISWLMPRYAEKVQGFLSSLPKVSKDYNLPPVFEKSLNNAVSRLEAYLAGIGDQMVTYLFGSMTFVSYLLLAPVIAYYILSDINNWRQRSLLLLARYPLPCVDLVRDIDAVVSGFVRGQSIVALCVMVLVFIMAKILGLKYAAFLGLVGGLGEFVPYFGPILAAIPTLIVAFIKSPYTALKTLAGILLIQWFDSNIMVPRVTGEKVGLKPLWIIFSLLASEELLGFWGIFLAVPLAGIVKSLIKFVVRLLNQRRS